MLPGYQGVIVRDGYAGYGHLTSALHAWCAVHLLRDLKGLYDFEPAQQQWASQLATLLIEARDAASAARAAGQSALDAAVLDDLVTRYRTGRRRSGRQPLPSHRHREDARRLARRFLTFEDMILRFATRPDLDIFSNNEAERTIRPVKSSSAAPEAAGGPSTDSPSSRSSSPTCPPPPNGASANSTPSASLFNGHAMAPGRPRTHLIRQQPGPVHHAADAC